MGFLCEMELEGSREQIDVRGGGASVALRVLAHLTLCNSIPMAIPLCFFGLDEFRFKIIPLLKKIYILILGFFSNY